LAFDFAMVLGFLFISGLALWVFLLMGRFLRMRAPGTEKLSTYECGEKPFGPAWFNFNNRFYIIALVFVAFDVMVALCAPIVVVFRSFTSSGQGGLAFTALFVFLGLLLFALVYVWAHGDLTWNREMEPKECAPFEIGKKE
jgi:NADH-quinone oxidoreductase subunit A